ncbi:MAG TPA: NFACT RNA binding domain-containing protein [Planctomycetota bacterium]|nr:NFACT RNA binding domain-containing protein [Planctomycetota bacterium]
MNQSGALESEPGEREKDTGPASASAPAALRCSPVLLADQVSRLQPLLPARLRALQPVLNGWRVALQPRAGRTTELLISLQPGALGLAVLDDDLQPLVEPLPPAFDPPPPMQTWFPALEGASVLRAFTQPGEPVVVFGLAPPPGGGSPARAVVLELFGAAGNIVELALEGKPTTEDAWLDGRVLNCFFPARTSRRALIPGEPYPAPRATPAAQRDLEAAFDMPAARETFATNLHAHWLAQAVDRLARPIRSESTRLQKRIAAISAQAGSVAEAERLVLEGQYLQAHPQRAARGFTTIDPRPERDVWSLDRAIPVQANLTLAENAAKLFQRAQRMRKAAAYARATLPGLQAEAAAVAERLAEVLAIANAADWPSAATQIHARLTASQFPPPRPPPAGQKQPPPATPQDEAARADIPRFVRRFLSSDGWVIDVGKSARDNHELTFHSAHGNDLLLHVAGATGAHVVVRCRVKPAKSADPEFPPATLIEAGRLCLHYSSRKAAAGEVVYALCKHCKPGARPGQVMIAKPKYLRVRSDPQALKQILDRKVR